MRAASLPYMGMNGVEGLCERQIRSGIGKSGGNGGNRESGDIAKTAFYY